jgi:hypothetical protein
MGTSSPPQAVTWSVSGGTASTTIDASGLLSIDANETAATLTVTATSTYDTEKSGTATVTVTELPPTPFYGVSLNTGNHTFAAATEGYGTQDVLSVTATNTGNQATGPLPLLLSGTDAGSFVLSPGAISSMAVGGHDTFTVRPQTGLAAGMYTATVTLSGANGISESFDVSFTVNAAPPAPSSGKEVAAITQPSGASINGTNISASVESTTTSLVVSLSVSQDASWKLYSDVACLNEIANNTMTLATGANTAYIKVTAADGSETVYTLTVTRAAPSPVDEANETDETNTGNTNTNTNTNTNSSGTLVTGTGRTNTNTTSNSSGTSQSSTQNGRDTNALDDDDKAASTRDLDVSSRGTDTTLSDTEIPLDTTDAFDDATDGQRGANPWVTAALIGLAVVALALILWFVLRRRRLAEELSEMDMRD